MLSPSKHIFIPFFSLSRSRTEWHLTAVSQHFLSLNQVWLLLLFSKIHCPLIQHYKIKRTEASSLQFWSSSSSYTVFVWHLLLSFLSQLILIFSILFTQDLSGSDPCCPPQSPPNPCWMGLSSITCSISDKAALCFIQSLCFLFLCKHLYCFLTSVAHAEKHWQPMTTPNDILTPPPPKHLQD